MSIVTRPATREYRDNFEATFGAKPKRPNECRIYNTTCPTPALCWLGDADAPCMAGETNDAEPERAMSLEELKTELKVAEDDLAPWQCLGCAEIFTKCPDFDAHNCPKCGEKVIPKRRLNARARFAGTYTTCSTDCEAEVFCASGDVVCMTCGETYREHKFCIESAYDPGYGHTAYATNVLCDGRHVHL